MNIKSVPPSLSAALLLLLLFALPFSCPPSCWQSDHDPGRDVPHPPRRRRTSSSPSRSYPVSTGQELLRAPLGGKQEHPFPLVSKPLSQTSVYVTACVSYGQTHMCAQPTDQKPEDQMLSPNRIDTISNFLRRLQIELPFQLALALHVLQKK